MESFPNILYTLKYIKILYTFQTFIHSPISQLNTFTSWFLTQSKKIKDTKEAKQGNEIRLVREKTKRIGWRVREAMINPMKGHYFLFRLDAFLFGETVNDDAVVVDLARELGGWKREGITGEKRCNRRWWWQWRGGGGVLRGEWYYEWERNGFGFTLNLGVKLNTPKWVLEYFHLCHDLEIHPNK